MRLFASLILLTFLLNSPVFANTPPKPPNKKETLKAVQKKLGNEKSQKKKLEEQADEIESGLQDTRKRLISISKKIQSNEKTLQSLNIKVDDLEAEQLNLQTNLKADQQSIARLILALERIRRVPPEALIAKPGAPYKTAQGAMLMRDIIPALNSKAKKLREDLETLENVSKDLNIKQKAASETATKLNAEHAKLSMLVDRREKLFAATHKDLDEQKRNVKKISAQAQNLQDLVKKLNKEKQRQKEKAAQQKIVKNLALPSPGSARLPISGIVRTSYNQKDSFGASSKGVSIEGVGGALVVAPMGGVIRFTGSFKNYGNMIILEHKDGYHSLVAGFEKIDTVVGQSVSVGEPLGLLHFAVDGKKPALYYELRYKGKAINPSRKLAGLS